MALVLKRGGDPISTRKGSLATLTATVSTRESLP